MPDEMENYLQGKDPAKLRWRCNACGHLHATGLQKPAACTECEWEDLSPLDATV
jgi:rubrerythrin